MGAHLITAARQVVLFILGIWLIVYAATTTGHDIPFLVTGLILLGMIPAEWLSKRVKDDEQRRDT